jgi:hypothetical protein
MERKLWNRLFSNVAKELGGEYSEMLFEELAIIMDKTDYALESLGVDYDVQPCNIPGVDTIQNLQTLNPNGLSVVEVLGMPGATKTTICAHIEKLNLPDVVVAKEPFGVLETLGIETRDKDTTEEIARVHFQTFGATLMELEDAVSKLTNPITGEKKGVVVADRSLKDHLVWADNLLLNGYIDLESYYISLRQHEAIRKLYKIGEVEDEYEPKSTFVLMVDSPTSLVRKGRVGRVLNERSLLLLYSQYLRLIADQRKEGRKNLVVLDMSDDIETNVVKFLEMYQKIRGLS